MADKIVKEGILWALSVLWYKSKYQSLSDFEEEF